MSSKSLGNLCCDIAVGNIVEKWEHLFLRCRVHCRITVYKPLQMSDKSQQDNNSDLVPKEVVLTS
jgi:hypothetical protein